MKTPHTGLVSIFLALIPFGALAEPVVQTAECQNNPALTCATGINGLEVMGMILNVDFVRGSMSSAYGDNLPPLPGNDVAALIAICEALRATEGLQGVIEEGYEFIAVPDFIIPGEGWYVTFGEGFINRQPGNQTDCFVGVNQAADGKPTDFVLGGTSSWAVFSTPVIIDIKPGKTPNSINPSGKQKIAVAILTTEDFDAQLVDPSTVRFGPGAATESHNRWHVKDVDEDGDWDLLFHFNTQETGIQCDDTEAKLTGALFSDGGPITGTDTIVTVNCP